MAKEFYVTIEGIKTGHFHGESSQEALGNKITCSSFSMRLHRHAIRQQGWLPESVSTSRLR
jgi:hypothetical protein